jgi:hypothetical protein
VFDLHEETTMMNISETMITPENFAIWHGPVSFNHDDENTKSVSEAKRSQGFPPQSAWLQESDWKSNEDCWNVNYTSTPADSSATENST